MLISILANPRLAKVFLLVSGGVWPSSATATTAFSRAINSSIATPSGLAAPGDGALRQTPTLAFSLGNLHLRVLKSDRFGSHPAQQRIPGPEGGGIPASANRANAGAPPGNPALETLPGLQSHIGGPGTRCLARVGRKARGPGTLAAYPWLDFFLRPGNGGESGSPDPSSGNRIAG